MLFFILGVGSTKLPRVDVRSRHDLSSQQRIAHFAGKGNVDVMQMLIELMSPICSHTWYLVQTERPAEVIAVNLQLWSKIVKKMRHKKPSNKKNASKEEKKIIVKGGTRHTPRRDPISDEKFMLRGGNLASAGGPSQPAETGIARAETLGPDGGQRTWKPGPDAAVGPTGAQESTPSLFPSGSTYSLGKSGGARGGGPRGMGEEGGRPVAGTRHATQPPAGAAAGRRASTVVACAVPLHGATVVGSNTGLGRGQDNGESSDVAQELGTTPGTASAVFPRLGYAMADGTNITRQPGHNNTQSQSQ